MCNVAHACPNCTHTCTRRYVRANIVCVREGEAAKLEKIEKELRERRSVIDEYERVSPGCDKTKAFLDCKLGGCVVDPKIQQVSSTRDCAARLSVHPAQCASTHVGSAHTCAHVHMHTQLLQQGAKTKVLYETYEAKVETLRCNMDTEVVGTIGTDDGDGSGCGGGGGGDDDDRNTNAADGESCMEVEEDGAAEPQGPADDGAAAGGSAGGATASDGSGADESTPPPTHTNASKRRAEGGTAWASAHKRSKNGSTSSPLTTPEAQQVW